MRSNPYLPVSLAVMALVSLPVRGEDPYTLTIKDHRFSPAELRVPVGQKVQVHIQNRDATPEEFESYELNREKVVPGGQEVVMYLGPLDRGRYPFFGDFHRDTATGVVVAQ
jgi:hypothetical protein